MVDDPQLQQALTQVKDWSRQTVFFAMSLRAARLGKDSNERMVTFAGKEVDALVGEWCTEIIGQAPPTAQPGYFIMPLVEKTFGWVTNHLS